MKTQASWKALADTQAQAPVVRIAWEGHAHKHGKQVERAARPRVRGVGWWSETYPNTEVGRKNMRRRARALRTMGHLTRVEKPTPDALVLNIALKIGGSK